MAALERVSIIIHRPLESDPRAALDSALRYFRDAAPKHTADEEESLFPRLRRLSNDRLLAVMARIESLEEEHICADRIHAEVDALGRAWLTNGALSANEASRLVAMLTQL